jgi:hypothetical protein
VLKEQFSKALEPYRTPSNTYQFDEEVVNSVFIALHTEERNRIHLYKHNEFNLQHIKQLLQYRAWQEELKKNVETEIIDKLTVLDRPLKEFVGIVEKASGDLKTNRLDSYNQEREKNHRQKGTGLVGFLSSLLEESEMDANDVKIKGLKENNHNLTMELSNKTRSVKEAQEQVERLKKERNDWQELYLKTVSTKRSSEDPTPTSDKRTKMEVGRSPECKSSSSETRDNVHREGSRWDVRPDLPGELLSKRKMSEVVINLWKEQCRKLNRYIPDRPQSGPNAPFPHGFNHGSNIYFLLTAASSFCRARSPLGSREGSPLSSFLRY